MTGDGETAALADRDGGIDRLCWPWFDNGACFSALLGGTEHGRRPIASAGPAIRSSACGRYATTSVR